MEPFAQPKARKRKLTMIEIEELVAGYQAGLTLAVLAGRYGLNRRTISAHLQRQGVQRRYRALGHQIGRRSLPTSTNQACRLLQSPQGWG